ncbi:MAG: ABC transporter ATP-binding protein/permease, partial [Gammaproteobacteria bacterium]|nr:ABC transporter ATP-binding protein/permease [Gammaproteobacteria bacterium]
AGDRGILRALLAAAWRSRARLLGALTLLLAARVASVLVPMVLKEIVDLLSQPASLTTAPIALLLGYALLRFSVTLFSELRDLVFSRVTQRTIAAYAQAAFDHLHRMGSDFHVRRRTGALLRDLDRGTNAVGYLMGVGLFTALPTLLEIALVQGVMLLRYSNAFAAIMGATFLVYGTFTFVITARRNTFQRRVNRLDSAAKGRMADSLLNHEAVKYFTNEPLESERFGRILGRWSDAAVLNQRVLFGLHVGQSLIIALGVGAVMLLAGRGVVDGTLTVGDLVLINAYVIQICLPLNSLGFVYRETRDALSHTTTLFRLLRRAPDLPPPGSLPALSVAAAEIRFEQVGFAYRKSRPVLSDVSFRVPAGTTTAVVGGSGSGKSTLARLLLRLHDPQVGRVLIDGQDLRLHDPRSIRALIGVVPQDTSLFNDTIAYNIGYGRPGASQAEIEAAARTARVHDLISALPEGYETVVGERGARLSGGERQRIGIARAVLKNPPILVFDEATSALDAENERAIQGALAVVAHARTTLVIAHRLATVVAADQILVLDHGRVVERGTHRGLLAADGLYARLWALQDGAAAPSAPNAAH